MTHLSPEAARLQHERLGRVKIENERAWIDALIERNPDRVRRGEIIEAAGQLWGFSLILSVRTCTRVPDETPELGTRHIEARFALGGYPYAPPQVILLCDAPLFLPGVAQVGDSAAPCLYRGDYDYRRMDLPFFVTQTWRALTVVPAVLNSVNDALDPEAAQWFIRRRDELALPLDAPLIEPADDEGVRPVDSGPRFVLRRVR